MAAGTDPTVDPRILRTRRVVLEAVLTELADVGYGGFTIESVAARAGVGKSTIYRHWSGRIDLVGDALRTLNVQPEVTATGSPREQVERLLVHLARALVESAVGACVPALIEAAERDDTVRDLFHTYSAQRRQSLVDAIARGIADGSFAAHIDANLAAEALSGAVFYRRTMASTPLAAGDVPALVNSVLGPA